MATVIYVVAASAVCVENHMQTWRVYAIFFQNWTFNEVTTAFLIHGDVLFEQRFSSQVGKYLSTLVFFKLDVAWI